MPTSNGLTDDVSGDGLVDFSVALVQDHEEQVEAAHDRRGDSHIGLQLYSL